MVRARGYKNITYNEPIFAGHFSGEIPCCRGSFMIEALAQLAADDSGARRVFRVRLPYLAGIDQRKFRRPVVPGDRLDMVVTMLRISATSAG